MLLIFRVMTSVYCVTSCPHAIKAVEAGLLASFLLFLLAATGIVDCPFVVVQKCNMLTCCYLPDKIQNLSLTIFALSSLCLISETPYTVPNA